jgi:hypothetical protein
LVCFFHLRGGLDCVLFLDEMGYERGYSSVEGSHSALALHLGIIPGRARDHPGDFPEVHFIEER